MSRALETVSKKLSVRTRPAIVDKSSVPNLLVLGAHGSIEGRPDESRLALGNIWQQATSVLLRVQPFENLRKKDPHGPSQKAGSRPRKRFTKLNTSMLQVWPAHHLRADASAL